MARGEIHIVLNSRPINKYLSDPDFPDSLKKRLNLIKEVRKYAMDSLGLSGSRNYTEYYDQHNKPAIWVLTACDPFSLKIKVWKFPFLGSVPYKGFFHKEEALYDQQQLMISGYDTKLGTTSGWSTLGWFQDPILSNMIMQSEGSIAELIIHELTHSTIFIKDNVQFNENIANFIGEEGAKKFLIFRFGSESYEFINYLNFQKDEIIYSNYVLHCIQKLDSLYKTFTEGMLYKEKKEKKESMIEEIVVGVSHLPLKNKYRYIRLSKKAIICKNAFFMEFVRYDAEHEDFDKKLKEKYSDNLRDFIQHLKE